MNIYIATLFITIGLPLCIWLITSVIKDTNREVERNIEQREEYIRNLIRSEMEPLQSKFNELSIYCADLRMCLNEIKKSKWQCYHNKMVDEDIISTSDITDIGEK